MPSIVLSVYVRVGLWLKKIRLPVEKNTITLPNGFDMRVVQDFQTFCKQR